MFNKFKLLVNCISFCSWTPLSVCRYVPSSHWYMFNKFKLLVNCISSCSWTPLNVCRYVPTSKRKMVNKFKLRRNADRRKRKKCRHGCKYYFFLLFISSSSQMCGVQLQIRIRKYINILTLSVLLKVLEKCRHVNITSLLFFNSYV